MSSRRREGENEVEEGEKEMKMMGLWGLRHVWKRVYKAARVRSWCRLTPHSQHPGSSTVYPSWIRMLKVVIAVGLLGVLVLADPPVDLVAAYSTINMQADQRITIESPNYGISNYPNNIEDACGSPEVALQYETNLHETLIWAANTACSHKLIAGDFNHPGITWTPAPELPERVNTSSPQSKFVECVRDSYLFQHITKPTRYRSQQTPTLDDLVFTNEREMILNMLRLEPLGASDHIGISADFLFTPSSPPMNKTTPNYNRGDYESLRNALDIEWKRELAGLTAQEMTNIIEKNITDAVEKHIPTRKHQTTSGDYTRKPLWMTRTAYQKTKRKRNLWIRYLNTKDNSDYQQYIKARNEATHANRRARRDFESKIAQESRHNTKTFWNYVNSRRVVKGSIPDLQDPQGHWANNMGMKLNPTKCKTMHLGRSNPLQEYTMLLDDNTQHHIMTTTEEKDLGMIVDSGLTFSKHIQTQINKANSVLGAIKHTFKALDPTAFLSLYKSLVRPNLEYASVIWSPKLKRDKNALEYVQRRATRLVTGLSGKSYEERLLTLELPTLEFRRQRADMIQMFKLVHGLEELNPAPCSECGRMIIQPALNVNDRGHDFKLQIQHEPGPRDNFFKRRATKNWNRLTQDTVSANCVNIFKNRLNKEWKNKPERYHYRFSY
ncbi:hypothetical protein Pcinc_013562 [Petrolisthes cinctipes]|uniref:Endonuclease/exonuclease/phosphatase domain-containing protein n=1 Tax=Petrolisthes cinctipes TaxID=88211 RepID=A0AAE1KS71_PETCI|nr:hypothetical protein Pcinc_013562 [Petrolisthes cinctipes]